MPGSTWTGDADRDMLLTIIEEGGSGKSIPWPEVARNLQNKGYTFSHEACRQHFQKIKRVAKQGSTLDPTSPADNNGGKSPFIQRKLATPRKRSAVKKEAGLGTPTRRLFTPIGPAHGFADMEDDDDDDELPPRSGRPGQPGAKRQRIVKQEEAGYDGDESRAYQFKTEQLGGPEHPEHGAIDLERNE
ncbi:uncharacterized protein RAG0_14059 [Rhynchosporium agropyri]|uniref:Myb-like domain-containing protein n=1 Tax=Rhynchosporium agropyri TaxID=914238 RepID=A0A1E1LFH4_9HELO|nr:uncharacterized protein RAG0_14059 [Rhynchosporium agropyri]